MKRKAISGLYHCVPIALTGPANELFVKEAGNSGTELIRRLEPIINSGLRVNRIDVTRTYQHKGNDIIQGFNIAVILGEPAYLHSAPKTNKLIASNADDSTKK